MSDLTRIRYAVALAESASYAEAAQRLGVAQPALSRQIARLESDLGVTLFERGGFGSRPTAAGTRYAERGARILRQVDQAGDEARQVERGQAGAVRIGMISSALLTPFADALSAVSRRHPDLALSVEQLTSSQANRQLSEGSLDVAIGRAPVRGRASDAVQRVVLSRDEVVAVVPRGHPLDGQRRVTADQLRGRRLIATTPDAEPDTARAVGALLRASPVVEAFDVWTICRLAGCGVGIGLAPALVDRLGCDDVWLARLEPSLRLPDLVLTVPRPLVNRAVSSLLGATRQLERLSADLELG